MLLLRRSNNHQTMKFRCSNFQCGLHVWRSIVLLFLKKNPAIRIVFFFFLFCSTVHADEILFHSASIKIYPADKTVAVADTFVVVTPASELLLQFASSFEILFSSVNGIQSFPLRDDALIQFRDIAKDTSTIIVHYCGDIPAMQMTFIADSLVVLRPEEIFPHGKNTLYVARTQIQVPLQWSAIGCGNFIQSMEENDSLIFVYASPPPLFTSGWFVAGKFPVVTSIEKEGIKISSYLFSHDTTHSAEKLREERLISLTENVFRIYQKKFGAYRFNSFALVEVENELAGNNVLAAAIHGGVLIKKQTLLSTDEFNSADAVLPHEIAHQWFPLTIFIEEKDAALLSEGLCEYAARLFHEAMGDTSMRDDLKNHPMLRSLIARAQQNREVPLQKQADLRALPTHYLKAYFVWNMLRKIMGKEVFDAFLFSYAERFRLKKISLEEFQRLAEEYAGEKNLDWFFEQWVKNTGIPRLKLYNVKKKFNAGQLKTTGNVRIVVYAQFTTPVEIEVQTTTEHSRQSVWLGRNSARKYQNDIPFTCVTDDEPIVVEINPDGDILLSKKISQRFSNLREPSDGILIIGSNGNVDSLFSFARRDSAAMENSGWWISLKADSNVTLADLQQERVFLYGTKEQNSIVEKFENYFSVKIKNDSAFYRDSVWCGDSVGVMQIIENPFRPNGLAIWITQLGTNASLQLLPYPFSYVVFNREKHQAEGTWEVEDDDYIFRFSQEEKK